MTRGCLRTITSGGISSRLKYGNILADGSRSADLSLMRWNVLAVASCPAVFPCVMLRAPRVFPPTRGCYADASGLPVRLRD